MKVTCIHNATLRVILKPETALESLQLSEMAARSEKGVKTTLVEMKRGGDAEVSQFQLEVG